MKHFLLILFLVATSLVMKAQDTKPVSTDFKSLQTPNNATFSYFLSDSTVWVFKGTYGWTKLAGAKKFQHKIDSLKTYTDSKFGEYYENVVTVAGTTSYILPYQLREKSQVWYNGVLLRREQWSGIGTIYISISGNIQIKDYFTIIF